MKTEKLYPAGHFQKSWVIDPVSVPHELDDDREPREPGCKCHLEAGDSPCPVHGEEEPVVEEVCE